MIAAIRWAERHLEESVACLCLAVAACCVFLQVLARYLFGSALTWTEELSGFAMAWAVYMGAALGVRERFHIRILVGVLALPRVLRLPMVLAADLAWLAFNLLMIRFGVDYLAVLARYPQISPALGVDQVWPQSVIVIGYGLMTLRLAQVYRRWIAAGARGLPGLPDELLMDGSEGASPS